MKGSNMSQKNPFSKKDFLTVYRILFKNHKDILKFLTTDDGNPHNIRFSPSVDSRWVLLELADHLTCYSENINL